MTPLKQILDRQEREFDGKFPNEGPIGGSLWIQHIEKRKELKSHILQDKLELLEAVEEWVKIQLNPLKKVSDNEPDINLRNRYKGGISALNGVLQFIEEQIKELRK